MPSPERNTNDAENWSNSATESGNAFSAAHTTASGTQTESTTLLVRNAPGSFETSLPVEAGNYKAIPSENGAAYTDGVHTSQKARTIESLYHSWGSAKDFFYKKVQLSAHRGSDTSVSYDCQKCNNLQTLMNLLKATTGTGILSLPLAFKYAGLWTGVFCFLLIALSAVHCMHCVSNCMRILEEKSNQELSTYPKVIEYAFKYGPPRIQPYTAYARVTATTLIYGMHFGVVTIFIVWIATNVKPVIDVFWSDSPDIRVYTVMVSLCLVPLVMIRSLKTLANFSAVANVVYVVGLCIIYQYILTDIPDASTRPAFGSWSTFPMFVGTAVYSFESICLIVPLRNKARTPEDFGGWTGVLTLGMVIITVIYCSLGFYGYLKFGDDIASVITLNLPNDQWLYLSVNLLFAAAMYISVGVQLYVPVKVMWPLLEPKIPRYKGLAEIGFRVGLLLILMTAGLIIPHIELLMALAGSVSGCSLSLFFPAVIDMITMKEANKLTWFVMIKDSLILLLGIVGCSVGTYTSLVQIVETLGS